MKHTLSSKVNKITKYIPLNDTEEKNSTELHLSSGYSWHNTFIETNHQILGISPSAQNMCYSFGSQILIVFMSGIISTAGVAAATGYNLSLSLSVLLLVLRPTDRPTGTSEPSGHAAGLDFWAWEHNGDSLCAFQVLRWHLQFLEINCQEQLVILAKGFVLKPTKIVLYLHWWRCAFSVCSSP